MNTPEYYQGRYDERCELRDKIQEEIDRHKDILKQEADAGRISRCRVFKQRLKGLNAAKRLCRTETSEE